MAKVTLTDVANLFGNPTSAANTINANSALIEAAFDNTLSRNGATPNQMGANLDMNHYDILNINQLSVDDIIVGGESVIQRIADEASIRAAADTALSVRISTIEHGAPIDTHVVNPLQFGAKGDGVTDDTIAIKAMIASGKKVVDWLGGEYIYRVTDSLVVTQPDVTWYGSALIRMDRASSYIKPLVIVMQSATNFWGADTLGYDHNAASTPQSHRVDDLGLVMNVCFLLMSDQSHAGGRFYNAFDVGLALASVDFTGDGSVATPYTITAQHSAFPQGSSFGRVYGYNCGCGEHISLDGLTHWNQGGAVDILTSSMVNGGMVIANRCYAGLICDFNSQASGNVASVVAYATKQDSRLPGGSGMGIYNGGMLTVGSYYGANNAGVDIVCYSQPGAQEWQLTMGAAFSFAAGLQGVFLGGIGHASGKFNIGHPSFITNGLPAFTVTTSGTENVFLNVDITSWGTTHNYGYSAGATSGGTIQGRVNVIDRGATAAAFFTSGSEMVSSVDSSGSETVTGKHSIGGFVNNASLAAFQSPVGTGLDLASVAGPYGVNYNCYWDGTNWRFRYAGWASTMVFNPSTGTTTIFVSNASGAANGVITFVTTASFTSTVSTINNISIGGVTPVANGGTGVTTSTGTGSVVLSNSPTLVTPALGTPSAAVLTNATGLPVASGISGLGTGVATFLATPTSANLAAAVTNETGTGALVFATSPTLVTPALGTPASGVMTNVTGLPLTTGVTGVLPTANGGVGTTNMAGSWTPQLNFGGAHVGLTTSSSVGTWTRIGNLVYITAAITLTAVGSSTGSATVDGLFAAIGNLPGYNIVNVVGIGMGTWTASKGLIVGGSASINIYGTTASGDTAMTQTAFTNSSTLVITGVVDLKSLT